MPFVAAATVDAARRDVFGMEERGGRASAAA